MKKRGQVPPPSPLTQAPPRWQPPQFLSTETWFSKRKNVTHTKFNLQNAEHILKQYDKNAKQHTFWDGILPLAQVEVITSLRLCFYMFCVFAVVCVWTVFNDFGVTRLLVCHTCFTFFSESHIPKSQCFSRYNICVRRSQGDRLHLDYLSLYPLRRVC